jgi:CopA family copper-resistance protein
MYAHKVLGKRSASAITRRQFVQSLMATGVIGGLDLWRWPAFALETRNAQAVLTGTHFDLAIEEVAVNFTGHPGIATAINGSVPGPLLRWREGDTVTLAVTNHLREQTSIHWHGVRSPADMDGVPGLSFSGIDPGETFVYRIPVKQYGTYWYHSHSAFQEQTGHYGPLIIERRGNDPVQFEREYVIMLSDWTDEAPETVLGNLKQYSSYYNFHQRTVSTFVSDAQNQGFSPAVSDRLMWGAMNMSPTDILDVSGATYTYLVIGRPPAANWTALFRDGERIRLRFINAASMSIFDVRIPDLPMTIVQADGNDVEPVTVDEFRCGAGGNLRRHRSAPGGNRIYDFCAVRRSHRLRACNPRAQNWDVGAGPSDGSSPDAFDGGHGHGQHEGDEHARAGTGNGIAGLQNRFRIST